MMNVLSVTIRPASQDWTTRISGRRWSHMESLLPKVPWAMGLMILAAFAPGLHAQGSFMFGNCYMTPTHNVPALIPQAGGTYKLNLRFTCAFNWKATVSVQNAWVTPDKGLGSAELTFSVGANPGDADRTINVNITNGVLWAKLAFPQAGPCRYSISHNTITPLHSGGSYQVSLRTRADCPWQISGDPESGWVQRSTPQPGEGVLTLSVSPNNSTTSSRDHRYTISGLTLLVSQQKKPADPAPVDPTNDAGSRRIVRSDFDGDGKADVAVWGSVSGTWYVMPSTQSCLGTVLDAGSGLHQGKVWCKRQFGQAGDEVLTGDYDGDGRADLAHWRKSVNRFFLIPSRGFCPPFMRNVSGVCERVWGGQAEKLVLGDYDGDKTSDQTLVRTTDFVWFVMPSGNQAPPSFSTTATTGEGQPVFYLQFGSPGDELSPGDYDGDGKTDPAVWRPAWGPSWGRFYIAPSSGICPQFSAQAGRLTSGKPYCVRSGFTPLERTVIADYNGDGRDDQAFLRDGDRVWSILPSGNDPLPPLDLRHVGFTPERQFVVDFQWGSTSSLPAQADYDGDGKADLTVWQPSDGHWLMLPTSGRCPLHFAASDIAQGRTFCIVQWGGGNDTPRP